MSTVVPGDPASCSQAGGSLRRLASQLRAAGADAARAGSEVEQVWSDRVARTIGRRRALLLDAVAATADQLDRAGALLQDHATDLADAVGEVRGIEDRAVAAGLVLSDGRLGLPWGVSGVADEHTTARREAVRSALQAELDRAVLHLGRRRARLAEALQTSRSVLAGQSAALRR